MTYEELLHEIVTDPERDEPRLALAELLRPSEPDRAQFIEQQIALANRDRADGLAYRGSMSGPWTQLLKRHESQWSRLIAKYTVEARYDRGFIASVTINPYTFLEYGEFLYANAPIVAVKFILPNGERFPCAEMAASPLLSRLVSIRFDLQHGLLSQDDLVELLRSPHLDSLLEVTSRTCRESQMSHSELAKIERVRHLLKLIVAEPFPGQRHESTGNSDYWGRDIYAWTGLQPDGIELETRYGYIPWLHPNDNYVYTFDARWFVAHGKVPKYPVGSMVQLQ